MWRVNGKWISELRRSLVEERIREEEFEEMEMKELLKRLKEKNREWMKMVV